MYQQVIIIGNVGRDPELSYTPQGIAVCKFSVAVNKVTGKGDNRKEKVTWFRVTAWRERAETANEYIHKGSKIMVQGEVEVSAYIDKEGKAQASLELTANDFKFLDSKRDGDQQRETAGERRGSDSANDGDIPF